MTALAAGARVGEYEIIDLVGAGGMGEVYRARDPHIGRDVAIKVLPASLAEEPSRVARFEQEARAAGILNHPNLLTIYALGTHDGRPFIVSELLEGETLRSHLRRGAIPPRRAVQYGIAIANGLAAAHAKGILHRDLKPENIFITSDDRLKILDFGLAKLTQPSSDEKTLPKTAEGVVAGTPGYMSPEQVRAEDLDARSDIFAFGTILYEMLSGEQPFRAGSSIETMNAILTVDPKPLAGIEPSLQRVVRHCLEKNRELRAHSARDVAYELETVSGFHESAKSRQPIWIAAAVVVVVVVAAVFWMRPHAAPTSSQSIDSLAVLPFVNATSDPKSDYLSDGVTDSVIDSMSQLPQLKVMSHSTMFKFKGKNSDPQDVGRQLHVRAVVAGRVSELADHLTIEAELVNVADGSQLWGEQYNRKLSDIFSIEEEIARDISQKLRLRLTGHQEQRLTKRYTDDVEAYELYLKGRQAWNKRTAKDLETAIGLFQQAIARDPHYALAYSGLADVYAVAPEYIDMPVAVLLQKGKEAAGKALEIDPDLGEAHATLALLADCDWQWQAAQREYERAIDLNPSYATAYMWYAIHLVNIGRRRDGVAAIERAEALDPLSIVIKTNIGIARFFAGDEQGGIAAYRDALQMAPNQPGLHLYLGRCLFAMNRHAEALRELRFADDHYEHRSPDARGALAYALGATGDRADAEAIARELAQQYRSGRCAPFYVAAAYAGFDEATALRYLNRALDEHDPNVRFFAFMTEMEHLRNTPQGAEVMRRLGLTRS